MNTYMLAAFDKASDEENGRRHAVTVRFLTVEGHLFRDSEEVKRGVRSLKTWLRREYGPGRKWSVQLYEVPTMPTKTWRWPTIEFVDL